MQLCFLRLRNTYYFHVFVFAISGEASLRHRKLWTLDWWMNWPSTRLMHWVGAKSTSLVSAIRRVRLLCYISSVCVSVTIVFKKKNVYLCAGVVRKPVKEALRKRTVAWLEKNKKLDTSLFFNRIQQLEVQKGLNEYLQSLKNKKPKNWDCSTRFSFSFFSHLGI